VMDQGFTGWKVVGILLELAAGVAIKMDYDLEQASTGKRSDQKSEDQKSERACCVCQGYHAWAWAVVGFLLSGTWSMYGALSPLAASLPYQPMVSRWIPPLRHVVHVRCSSPSSSKPPLATNGQPLDSSSHALRCPVLI
jgi:hypothetical protein